MFAISLLISIDSIIAVHGLGRHMRGSWTSNEAGEEEECMWLRDMLPSAVPRVRIHAFSYAPTEKNNAVDILNGDALTGVAEALLREVASMRKDSAVRLCSSNMFGSSPASRRAQILTWEHRTWMLP